MVFAIEHHPNYVQRCLVAIAASDERNLRSRHHQRNGNEELTALQTEVGNTQIQGQIRGRQIGSEFLFQLPLLVVWRGMFEVRRSVIASAVLDLRSGQVALHYDATIMPVARGVRTVIAEQV